MLDKRGRSRASAPSVGGQPCLAALESRHGLDVPRPPQEVRKWEQRHVSDFFLGLLPVSWQ